MKCVFKTADIQNIFPGLNTERLRIKLLHLMIHFPKGGCNCYNNITFRVSKYGPKLLHQFHI